MPVDPDKLNAFMGRFVGDIGAVMHRADHSQLSTTQIYFDELSDAPDRALEALARMKARNAR